MPRPLTTKLTVHAIAYLAPLLVSQLGGICLNLEIELSNSKSQPSIVAALFPAFQERCLGFPHVWEPGIDCGERCVKREGCGVCLCIGVELLDPFRDVGNVGRGGHLPCIAELVPFSEIEGLWCEDFVAEQ